MANTEVLLWMVSVISIQKVIPDSQRMGKHRESDRV